MPLVDYWKKVALENYVNFEGRARRAEFWWFGLANLIVEIVLVGLGRAVGIFYVVYGLYALAMVLPGIAVAIRRLHDTGKSGLFLLLVFVPFVGAIVLLVFFLTDSTRGTNEYGVSPKYPA